MTMHGPRTGAYRGTTAEMRKVIAWAEPRGWLVGLTRGNHLCFRKVGCEPVHAAFTGRPCSTRNTLALLKRAELVLAAIVHDDEDAMAIVSSRPSGVLRTNGAC